MPAVPLLPVLRLRRDDLRLQFPAFDIRKSQAIVSCQAADLDTNLLVTTDRCACYWRLISNPEEYVASVAFAYPEGDERKWREHLAQKREEQKSKEHVAQLIPSAITAEELCFSYSIRGGDESRLPESCH